jgi:uncharacterized protein (TIGR02453 family)
VPGRLGLVARRATKQTTSGFSGFPTEALDFYDDLEMDNSKTFWAAHKDVYERAVKTPMTELTNALGPEFGEAKIFRPYRDARPNGGSLFRIYRDTRFAKDKTPYKTAQGAYVATGPSTGWYVQVSAPGVRVGFGFYGATSERLGRIRDAIADDSSGRELEKILASLRRSGWTVGGESLKTTPRGYAADHARIDLLRHKSLTIGKDYGFEPFIHSSDLLQQVRKDWRAGRPFLDWVAHYAG